MDEYLTFRRLITPSLVQIYFWIGLVVIVFRAVFFGIFGGAFWEGIALLVVGPLALRILCEVVIVLFRINNTLTDLLDLQRETVAPVAAPAAASTVVPPPIVP